VKDIFTVFSHQVFTWTLKGSSEQVCWLHHHLILWHLNAEDELHQWQQLIVKMRNLNGYTSFFVKSQAKQRTLQHTHQSEKRNSSKAHKEYLTHIYTDWTLKNYKHTQQALKKNLQHEQQWSILVDEFVTDDRKTIFRLDLGLLLLCEPVIVKKML